jgi:hypothetical protein
MISPVTGQGNKGLMRAEIKGGVREVIACKDSEGKIGLRLRNVNNVSINYLPKAHYSITYNDSK